ncbi:MAG: DUF6883 domain-containing protein [Cyanobacteria bacterium J06560_6]
MKLQNGRSAIIPMEKLLNYCLNSKHPSGKHKAKVFASALGITAQNAEDLRELIRRAAIEGDVIQQADTSFGQTWKVDWLVPGDEEIILRTLWETTTTAPNPRLISAFIR